MPYTVNDHRRNHRQIDILLGQRPSKKILKRRAVSLIATKSHLIRLEWVLFAILASQKEFHIVFLPSLVGDSKKISKKRRALQHIRSHRPAKNLALSRLRKDIRFLKMQLVG